MTNYVDGATHGYDPELIEWAGRLAPIDYLDPAGARARLAALFAAGPSEPNPDVTERDTTAGDVPLRVYRPAAGPADLPCVLYVHGGGFVLGDLQMSEARARRVVAALGVVVVSVDYRLAPEHPFPAGLEDCYTALTWVAAHTSELGIDAGRIAVAGDSAGAGLAAALALLARDRTGPSLCLQYLDFPTLDDRQTTVSARTLTDTPNLDSATLAQCWAQYIGPGGHALPLHYAAPLRADDLRGLPPACIVVNQYDPVRDEGILYAQRLAQAGVATELHLYPGTFHGSTIVADAAITRRIVDDQLAALGRGLHVA